MIETEDARTEAEATPTVSEGKAKKARAPRKPKRIESKPKAEKAPKAKRAAKPKAPKAPKAEKPKAKTKAAPKAKAKGGKRHPETGIDYSKREMPARLKPKKGETRPDTNAVLLKMCSKKAYSIRQLIESGKFPYVRDSGVSQAVKRLFISGDLALGDKTIPTPSGKGRAAFTYVTSKQGQKRIA